MPTSAEPERTERSPRRLWIVVVLALVLHLPSLRMGFYADDYVHQAALHEPDALPLLRPWSLYDFGSYADWAPLHARLGAMPWWTDPSWKVRFFRPVASLSLWLDAQVFGRWPPGYHLTSLCCYALLLVALGALFRELGLSEPAALWALVFFALGDATMLPVAWVANRNALLAALFTVLAVLAIARGERMGERRALALGLGAAAMAALSRESGVAAFALVALELLRRSGRTSDVRAARRARLGAAAAFLAGLAYVAALASAGFGTQSLFYATPWNDPLRFLEGVARLSTLGLLSLAGPLPLDALSTTGANLDALALAAVLPALGLVAWIARRVREGPNALPLAAFLFLALAAEGGAPLSDRLLFTASIGSAGILALFFEHLRLIEVGRLERIAARLLFLSSTLGSGVFLLLQSLSFTGVTREIRAISIEADVGARALGRREVLLLQAPSALAAFALPSTWAVETGDREIAFWPVQTGRRGLRWTRIDERSFDIESLDESLLGGILEIVYLAERERFELGRRWRTPLFEVEATRVEGGDLRAIRLMLDRSADDEHLRYLVAREGRYVHRAPPAIGETIVIERAPPLRPLLP